MIHMQNGSKLEAKAAFRLKYSSLERKKKMKYTIEGAPMPVAICELESGEMMITERGSMSWMSPNMLMETTSNGGLGKAFGRMFAGETMFLNHYTAQNGPGMIAFASSFPGEIRVYDISPEHEMIVQKSGFLAAEKDVTLSVFFQRKLGAGLVGGEGFIMEKLSGRGTAFCEFDGHIKEYELAAGQSIIVDTGYLAAMDATCTMEVQTVKGIKNKMLGGEGFFNTVIKGPGKVYLQSMPIIGVAQTLSRYMTSEN